MIEERTCPKCGEPIGETKICPNCSYEEEAGSDKLTSSVIHKKKFYEKNWFIILMLLLFFPVGIFLMWKFTNWKKAVKVIVTALLVLCFIGTVIGDNNDSSNKSLSKAASTTPKLSAEEQFATDNGISKPIAKAIIDASKQIGIPSKDITSFTKGENWDQGESYNYDYNGYTFGVFLNADNTVSSIISGEIVFYLEGTVVFMVQDKIVTTDQMLMLIDYTETAIKAILKSPSTAVFPGKVLELDQWNITRDKNKFTVSSYVDSQNSFGATLRSNFTLEYTWDGDLNTVPTVTNAQME